MENSIDSYYRKILDAIPLMIFVVDDDIRIYDLDDTARKVFGLDKKTIYKRRAGEILHCLHSYDVPDGCGRAPFCRTCIIRNSVMNSFKGQTVTRRRTKAELLIEGTKKELELLITASPMPSSDESLALLVIEDISEISALKDIIPICAKCKKIRDDDQYWHSVESYFNDYLGLDFSHGICPTCMKELYPFVEEKEDKKE